MSIASPHTYLDFPTFSNSTPTNTYSYYHPLSSRFSHPSSSLTYPFVLKVICLHWTWRYLSQNPFTMGSAPLSVTWKNSFGQYGTPIKWSSSRDGLICIFREFSDIILSFFIPLTNILRQLRPQIMPCGKSDTGKWVWINFVWQIIHKENCRAKNLSFQSYLSIYIIFLKISIIVLYNFHYCSEKIRLQSSKTCIIKLTTQKMVSIGKETKTIKIS